MNITAHDYDAGTEVELDTATVTELKTTFIYRDLRVMATLLRLASEKVAAALEGHEDRP